MYERFRIIRRLVLVVAAFAVIAAACGSDGTPSTSADAGSGAEEGNAAEESAVAEESVAVSVWVNDNTVAECFVNTALDSFDDVSIEVDGVIQLNQWDTTRTAISGGAGPDIVISPGPSFAFELAKSGSVLPLGGYVDSLGLDDSFVDWALSLGIVDGQLYSLPTELETMVLYYNKTLFEQNGWEPPSTVDELVSLAGTVADAGITPFAGGNAEWRPANEWYMSAFFNAVAGPDNVYAALIGEKSFADAQFAEAASILNDFQQNGWLSGGLDRYYTATFDEFLSALGNGEAAMNIEGSWRLEDIDTFFGEEGGNDNDWDWVPFPSASGEDTFSIGIGSTFSINANSDVPDQSAQVLAHIFAPETQAALAVECGVAPAPVRVDQSMFGGLDERTARLFASIADASDAGNYGYLTWTFWPPESDTYIYEELERVWNNDISPQDYVDGLAELFTQELEAGSLPPIPER